MSDQEKDKVLEEENQESVNAQLQEEKLAQPGQDGAGATEESSQNLPRESESAVEENSPNQQLEEAAAVAAADYYKNDLSDYDADLMEEGAELPVEEKEESALFKFIHDYRVPLRRGFIVICNLLLFLGFGLFLLYSAPIIDKYSPKPLDVSKYPIRYNAPKIHMKQLSKYWGTGSNWQNAYRIQNQGVWILTGGVKHHKDIEVSLDNNEDYIARFFLNKQEVGHVVFPNKMHEISNGLYVHSKRVPESARIKGYDRIYLLPDGGDNIYCIGHIFLRN